MERFFSKGRTFVAIFLGSQQLTAWASWQDSLCGGNQAQKYTKGTALVGEANSLYNEAAQYSTGHGNLE